MNWRQLLIVPPVLASIAAYMWMSGQDNGGQETASRETALAVRVAEISAVPFRPAVSGYGRVAAASSWSAISQVQGRTVFVGPGVSVGRIVNEGDPLVVIDPRDYEIALTKAESARDAAMASLSELDVTEANLAATLELELRIEAFLQSELERQANLQDRGTAARAAVEQANRTLLAQQKVVLDLRNKLNLLPVQRRIHATTLATRNAEIEEARRNLERTGIDAPLDGRVTRKSVALGQFVRSGDILLTVESIDAAEIVAEFRPQTLRNLIGTLIGGNLPTAATLEDMREAFEIIAGLDLAVTVHAAYDDGHAWPARLTRFSGRMDERTGAVGLAVQVDDPALPDAATGRPPLINGAFVEVRLSAPEPDNAIMIMRTALRTDPDGGDFVLVVNEDSRLARRDVVAGPVFDDRIVVQSGLGEGDRVVLSDPRPAVYGMLLEPVPN